MKKILLLTSILSICFFSFSCSSGCLNNCSTSCSKTSCCKNKDDAKLCDTSCSKSCCAKKDKEEGK